MQIYTTLGLFVAKTWKFLIRSDIAEQSKWITQRLISLKISVKLERRILPLNLWILLNVNPPPILKMIVSSPGTPPSPPPSWSLSPAGSKQMLKIQLGKFPKFQSFCRSLHLLIFVPSFIFILEFILMFNIVTNSCSQIPIVLKP